MNFFPKTFLTFVFIVLFACLASTSAAQVLPVVVQDDGNGNYTLLRDGQPYFIKGGGGDENLDRLVVAGGNSYRTWGTDANFEAELDAAHAAGLSVMMGLWAGHERHGFNYNDPVAVAAQLEDFRQIVRQYKDHPAVLLWGVGNEVELGYTNTNVWYAIGDIAQMIHEEDGNHPTVSVLAEVGAEKIGLIMERAPAIDIIGINSYGSAGTAPERLQQAGWNGPYIMTEWGPKGHWESPRTDWEAPIEQSGTDKAQFYFDRYADGVAEHTPGKCLGSYVFLWGQKQERTSTWFSLFQGTFETEVVDVMQYHWTGSWPENRAPQVDDIMLEGQPPTASVTVSGPQVTATVPVTDPDGDNLTYEWLITEESNSNASGGDAEPSPDLVTLEIISESPGSITFKPPPTLQNYRLFVYVYDGHGNVGYANFPFRVELAPATTDSETLQYPVADTYIRDGVDYAFNIYNEEDPDVLVMRHVDEEGSGRKRIALVQFDLSNTNRNVTNATLHLYGQGQEGLEVGVFGTVGNDNFLENTRFGTAPELRTSPISVTTLTAEEKYFEFDVTEWIRVLQYPDLGVVAFALQGMTEMGSTIRWHSRESVVNTPYITMEVNDEPIEQVVSLTNLSQRLRVFPNPTTDLLQVSEAPAASRYSVVNLQGQELLQGRLSGAIDVSTLPEGLYFLHLASTNGVGTWPFVKQ